MSRVPLLSIEASKEAAAEAGIVELKAVGSLYRVLLRHRPLAKCINDLIDTLMGQAAFDARWRELIILRIGWVNEGVYEWSQHWRIALQLGVEERDMLAVRDWEAYDHWSAADRAILRATDETLGDGVISAETWEQCAKHLPTDQERLELVATIGSWKMMSELLQSLDVPLEEGIAPWPPDGDAPAAPSVGAP